LFYNVEGMIKNAAASVLSSGTESTVNQVNEVQEIEDLLESTRNYYRSTLSSNLGSRKTS